MSKLATDLRDRYTWNDYRTWGDGDRWELVGGEAFDMSPAPGVRHQDIAAAPKLVVEILSPATALHDRIRKFKLYERYGVEEYRIVTPYPPMIEVYRLVDGRFALAAGYEDRDTLRSPAFPELEIPLAGVFDFLVAPEDPVKVVREGTPPYALKQTPAKGEQGTGLGG